MGPRSRTLEYNYKRELNILLSIMLKNKRVKGNPRSQWSTGEFYRTSKEQILLISHTVSQGRDDGDSHYVADITWNTKPDKNSTRKENYGHISLMNISVKILTNTLASWIE